MSKLTPCKVIRALTAIVCNQPSLNPKDGRQRTFIQAIDRLTLRPLRIRHQQLLPHRLRARTRVRTRTAREQLRQRRVRDDIRRPAPIRVERRLGGVPKRVHSLFLEVASHRREVHNVLDPERGEDGGVADAGELEDLRAMDRTSGEDDFAPCVGGEGVSVV